MKANVTYVNREEFEKVAAELGCKVEAQAGFLKVTKEGAKAILYVAKTKACGRVDISNTIIEGHPEEIVDLGGESFGKVKQQLRFDRPAEEIIKSFRWLCENLTSFTSLPATVRQRPVALAGSKKKEGTTEVQVQSALSIPEQIEELVAKRSKLLETAKAHNATINPATLEKLDSKVQGLFAQLKDEEKATVEAKYPAEMVAGWKTVVSTGPEQGVESPTPNEPAPQ